MTPLEKDNILGLIVKNCAGYTQMDGKQLWQLDLESLEKDLVITDLELDPSSPCPLTKSSHEKALVRVVEKYAGSTIECDMHKEYIQSICICGYIVNENELKYE